ncbi:MAG TPA: OmpA family protein [Saprospiraceae bacterium]|nr:OmpA family protein [Saprospiraceae bacterium]
MKKIYFALTALFLLAALGLDAQDLPKEAEPGKCYVKCIIPDKFEEITETVIVKPEYTVLETVPPVYETITEEVLVKEASKELKVIPAVYETIEIEYISKEEAEKLNVIPASFVDDAKEFVVYPETGRWEYKILEDCPSVNKEDCMVACFVEYPERRQTVPLKKINADASTEPEAIPRENATYKKQVVKTPARVEEITIPEEYATITKKVIKEEAQVVEKIIPAVTKDVTITKLVEKGGMAVWEEVDCGLVGVNNLLPILYEFNSARLTSESKRIIDNSLLELMREKEGLMIELRSHTDSRGNDEYNMALSQQRAQSVVNYLVNKGIARERLVAKGFGETQLVNRCGNGVECSEAEHQKNRRTEFRIITAK